MRPVSSDTPRHAAATLALAALLALNGAAAAGGPGLLMTEQGWAQLKVQLAPQRKSMAGRCEKATQASSNAMDRINPPRHYSDSGSQHSAETTALFGDGRNAYQAAICYRLTGELRFAKATQRFIDAWADKAPKVAGPQGQALVNFALPHFLLAASWVRNAGDWDDRPLINWVNTGLRQYPVSSRVGNHANWGALFDMSIAAYQQDDAAVDAAARRWRELVLEQVSDDGTLLHEVERSGTSNFRGGPDKGIRGLAYTHYALLPLAVAAEIASVHGRPVFDDASTEALRRAVRKTAGWVANPASFPHYAGPAEDLAAVKQMAYFAILLRHFQAPEACEVLRSTAPMGDQFQLMTLFASSLSQTTSQGGGNCP